MGGIVYVFRVTCVCSVATATVDVFCLLDTEWILICARQPLNPSILSVCALLNYLKLDLEAKTSLYELIWYISAPDFDLKASIHNNFYLLQ